MIHNFKQYGIRQRKISKTFLPLKEQSSQKMCSTIVVIKLKLAVKTMAWNSSVSRAMDLHCDQTSERETTPCHFDAHRTACKINIPQNTSTYIDQRQVKCTEPEELRAETSSLSPLPSPYVRKISNQQLQEASTTQHPLMQPIIWRRIKTNQK
jgi:hypothetical protein